MKKAMEGNWSEVIDGQTKAAVGGNAANTGTVKQAGKSAAAAAAAAPATGPLVSPFQQAAVHRSIGGSMDVVGECSPCMRVAGGAAVRAQARPPNACVACCWVRIWKSAQPSHVWRTLVSATHHASQPRVPAAALFSLS
jgi:hypothetical protein